MGPRLGHRAPPPALGEPAELPPRRGGVHPRRGEAAEQLPQSVVGGLREAVELVIRVSLVFWCQSVLLTALVARTL